MTRSFPIHLFEEHSSTLPVWWDQPAPPRTVVYLDAHLDLQRTGEEGIRALEACRSMEDVSALEAPHHLESSSRYAFGIEDFLYPAHRLGLIDRLVWLAPPHVPREYSHALLEYVEQIDGITFEELTGFVRTGRSALRGRLLGLDITLCDVDDLDALELPGDYCLDIDVDYFVTVPGDTLWTDPARVLGRVLETLGLPRLATVSRAVSSGFTPLKHRFLGDYAAALLAGDSEAVRQGQGLYQAVQALERGERERAAELSRALLASTPGGAAACYLLGLALGGEEEGRQMRMRAAELDPAYQFDLSREASAYPNRRLPLSAERLRFLTGALQTTPAGSRRRALGTAALARLYAEAGAADQALQLLGNSVDEANGEAALAIAVALLAGSTPERAVPVLECARRDAKTCTSAVMQLGDLHLRAGRPARALALYEEAAARAPAWRLPLQRLRQCHEALGQGQEARRIARVLSQRERIIEGLGVEGS